MMNEKKFIVSEGNTTLASEKKFIVSEGNTTLASEMTLDDALLFIKAYIEKYYRECLSIRITEMKEVEEVKESDREYMYDL